MATQLATLFLKRLGVPLVIRDLDRETVDRAVASIREELEGRWCPIEGTTSVEDFAGCDLVLEAVFEEMSIKQQVFAELREVVGPDCILATNTSALSVAETGADLGLHFFNPVALMPLVELVAHRRDRRRQARYRVARSRRTCASARCSSATRPASSSTAC